jgi:hypothetical protein
MKETLEINNKTLYLQVVTGVATSADENRITKRKLEVSGGGGYIHNGTGYIDPVSIEEKVTEEHRQNFVLLGLDDREREFNFKNESVTVSIRPGNIVSVVLGSKKPNGKKVPYIIYNHNSRRSVTTDAFSDAVAFSNIRMTFIAMLGLLAAFIVSGHWFTYLLFPVIALALHYAYFFKIKGYLTAGDYLCSDECQDWLLTLRENDDEFQQLVNAA